MARSKKRTANKKKKRNEPLTAIITKKELLRILKRLFILCGFLIIGKAFIIDIGFVARTSMNPTLKQGEIVWIKKWDVHMKTKGSGIHFYDVVKISGIENDKGEKKDIVKRVIGLPGDQISIVNGIVYRNGEAIKDEAAVNIDSAVNLDCKVGKDQIFVLGDNRKDSWDSKDFGTLPIEKVLGVVLFQ